MARLLTACNPATLTGSRDLALLTLVARLGLRSAEVARLELDDIDWRAAGEFMVRGKARRVDRLPLVTDVREALAGWLRRRLGHDLADATGSCPDSSPTCPVNALLGFETLSS